MKKEIELDDISVELSGLAELLEIIEEEIDVADLSNVMRLRKTTLRIGSLAKAAAKGINGIVEEIDNRFSEGGAHS